MYEREKIQNLLAAGSGIGKTKRGTLLPSTLQEGIFCLVTHETSSISMLTCQWEPQGHSGRDVSPPARPRCSRLEFSVSCDRLQQTASLAQTACPVSSQVDKADFVMTSPTQLACCRREINKLHARDGAAVRSDLPAVFSHRRLSSGVDCSIKLGGHKLLSG